MRLLLDTHVFLWTLDDSPRLSQGAREMMTVPGTECFVSSISFWEIAIKAGLRWREFRVNVAELLSGARSAGLRLLPFQPEHAVRVARLAKHHSDPFDRALVAQALVEPLTLLTQDKVLASYGRTVHVV